MERGALSSDASPVDQLRRYIAVFGDKPCCFADLRLYTDLLSADEQRQVTTSSVWASHVQMRYRSRGNVQKGDKFLPALKNVFYSERLKLPDTTAVF